MKGILNYTLAALLVTTVACSGGGGGDAPTPETNSTGDNGTVAPPAGTKLPDGSIQLSDGRIQKPDGSIVDKNGIIIKPDGTVVFPEGSTKLPDGTMKLPNGAIAKKDGTIVVAVKSDETPAGGDTKTDVPPIIPMATITGVLDGGIYAEESLTADASGSTHVTSYDWSLTGKGLAEPLRGSGSTFTFTLPKNTSLETIQYILTLKVLSSDKHTAERLLHLNAAPVPIAKVKGPVPSGGKWSIYEKAVVSGGSSLNFTKLNWKVQRKDGDKSVDVAFTEKKEDNSISFGVNDGIGSEIVVTLVAEGVGGKSDPASYSIYGADIPDAIITSDVKEAGAYPKQAHAFTGSTDALESNISNYIWKVFNDKNEVLDSAKGATASTFNFTPASYGNYKVTLQLLSEGDTITGSEASVSFEIVPPPTVVLSGVEKSMTYPTGESLQVDVSKSTGLGTRPNFVWKVTGPQNFAAVTGKEAQLTFTPDVVGAYALDVSVEGPGGTSTTQVSFDSLYLPIPKLSSNDILAGHAYKLAPLSATSEGTKDATNYIWTLLNENAEMEFSSTAPAVTFTPKSYGRDVISLVAGNAAGKAPSKQLPFNVRYPQIQVLEKIAGTVRDIRAPSATNIYIVTSNGLYHYGADKRVVQVDFGDCDGMTSVFIRSVNEIFVTGDKEVCRWTAGKGVEVIPALVLGDSMKQIAGDANRLFVVRSDGDLYRSSDHGQTWEYVDNLVARVAIAGDKLFIGYANTTGVIAAFGIRNVDGAANLVTKSAQVSGNWSALQAIDASHAVMAADSGEVCQYDGEVSCFGKLPTTAGWGGDAQQYAKAIYKNDTEILAVTQYHGLYRVKPTSIEAVIEPNTFLANAGYIGAAGIFSDDGPSLKIAADGQWSNLTNDKYEFYNINNGSPGTGFKMRRVGNSLFLLNVKTADDTGPALRRIAPEGESEIVSSADYPLKTIYALWGPDMRGYYFATESGLMKWDSALGVKLIADHSIFEKSMSGVTEYVTDIAGLNEQDFYVLTNLNVLHTIDGGKTFTPELVATNKDVKYNSIVVTKAGDIFVGESSGIVMSKKAGGDWVAAFIAPGVTSLMKVAGSFADDGLYAVTGTKDVYRYQSGTWSLVAMSADVKDLFTNINDFTVVSKDEVWLGVSQVALYRLLHYNSGQFELINDDTHLAEYIQTVNHQVYYGRRWADGTIGVFQFGPMQ